MSIRLCPCVPIKWETDNFSLAGGDDRFCCCFCCFHHTYHHDRLEAFAMWRLMWKNRCYFSFGRWTTGCHWLSFSSISLGSLNDAHYIISERDHDAPPAATKVPALDSILFQQRRLIRAAIRVYPTIVHAHDHNERERNHSLSFLSLSNSNAVFWLRSRPQ